MKTSINGWLGIAAVVLLAACESPDPILEFPGTGQLGVYPIHLEGLGGQTFSDAELGEGATIAVIWASWSPRSRDIVERVNPLVSRWGTRARVITINFQEDRESVRSFLSGRFLLAPVFLDSEGAFSKKFGIATLPSMLVVMDGQVVFRGRLPDDPDRVIGEFLR
ncbi:MAG: TlpA family protein disulfide reductase [Longimicrobiales bacterium]